LKYNNYILKEREKEREFYVMRLNVTTAQLVPNISNKLFLNIFKQLLLMCVYISLYIFNKINVPLKLYH